MFWRLGRHSFLGGLGNARHAGLTQPAPGPGPTRDMHVHQSWHLPPSPTQNAKRQEEIQAALENVGEDMDAMGDLLGGWGRPSRSRGPWDHGVACSLRRLGRSPLPPDSHTLLRTAQTSSHT